MRALTLLLGVVLAIGACNADSYGESSASGDVANGCEGPSECREDSDCFVDMCMGSVCINGLCSHEPRPEGTRCIQWSVDEQRHIAGYCAACRCSESTAGP